VSLSIARAGESSFDRRAPGTAVAAGDFVPDAVWFAARRESFGSEALRLQVGPLEFRLEGLNLRQVERLRGMYGPFLRPAAAEAAGSGLTISLTRAGVERFLALPSGRFEEYRLGRRTRDGRHDLWAYEFAATADAGFTRAEVALLTEEGAEFNRGLENVLRFLCACTILDRGGLLVHGAGIVRGGRAHVFFGHSGAGKTTVTALSPRDLVLSDDITVVLPAGDRFVACGHPFGMAHHRVPDTTDSFPIAGLYRLLQSREVRLEPLDRGRGLGDLASCLPFVMQDAASAARALDIAAALLRTVPSWRLSFRKDDAFWGAIENR
jgi:hypothetical protein